MEVVIFFLLYLLTNEEVRKSYELLRIVPKTTISTGSSKPGKDATILRITNKSGKEKSMFEIIYDGQSIKEASASEQYHSRGAFGFPHWIEVTTATGLINLRQTTEVPISHEEMHTLQDIIDGIPQA
ncbi:hypothetical protein AAC387_Pa07g1237 [Persea americana]